MIPVLGGEVEEGEQRFPVLREAGNGLIILGVVFVSEHIDRYLGRRAGWRAVDLAKVDLHVDLDREGDLVQYVGGLVEPNTAGVWCSERSARSPSRSRAHRRRPRGPAQSRAH